MKAGWFEVIVMIAIMAIVSFFAVITYTEKRECEKSGGVFIRQMMSITEPNVCIPGPK